MRTLEIVLFVSCLVAAVDSYGQKENTTLVPTDQDSVRYLPAGQDTAYTADSLSEAEQAMMEFEKRRLEFQQALVERKPELSFFDSLTAYFTSDRLDQRTQVEQSWYHDAGDYCRFDPSYFVLDYQSTPMRKTVQPFGLAGNRLNVIANRMPLEPFEHKLEPDGLVDLNDIPADLDHRRFILPGPGGLIFGGNQAVATLLTLPNRPDSRQSESAIMVDQGSFDYNYVRGRYSKLFAGMREIDMSVGYRNADGIAFNRGDDAYHYTGRIFQPLSLNYGLNASGQLYSREGSFVVQPDRGGASVSRNRIDRNAEISLNRHNLDHDTRLTAGYRYRRHGSHLSGPYKGRFDVSGWGLFAAREWIRGSSVFQAELRGDRTDYTDGREDFSRGWGKISLSMARFGQDWRYAILIGSHYVDGFNWLPVASAILFRERPNLFVILAAGYSARAPSLHELHLRFQSTTIYPGTAENYADEGNPDLAAEKQLVATGLIEVGDPRTNLRLTATGGSIKDGIDWQARNLLDPVAPAIRLFSPVNGDIKFADVSLQQKLSLGDFLRLRSGGAYHWLDYEMVESRPYSPQYQVFSGMELHYYWPQKIMDLFVYAEATYISEYDGYDRTGLGNQILGNLKLSFRIKGFRFHWVFQNVISTEFEPREYMVNPGRYSYYGIVWNFLD